MSRFIDGKLVTFNLFPANNRMGNLLLESIDGCTKKKKSVQSLEFNMDYKRLFIYNSLQKKKRKKKNERL